MKNKHPVLRRFMRRKVSVVAAAVLILFVLIAILGPLVWQVDPLKQSVMKKYGPMTAAHPLGTDNLGRDTLARMIYGARVSLAISFAGVLSGALIGVLLGVSAGYFGGWVDAIISRFIDILLAFPGLLLAITIVAVLGPGSVNTVIAITIFTIPGLTRMVRSVVLSLKSSEYVEACKTMGESNLRIIFTHVIPNSMSQIIVNVTLSLGTAILTASSLSFLGLGVTPPEAEWGAMLSQMREVIRTYPTGVLVPGIAITLVVMSFSLVGDGLRDALDPKLKITDDEEVVLMSEPVLQVKGLKTYYYTEEGVVPAVDGLDFEVEPGETFAIVGESGCGKSVTSLSILRLIPSPPGKIIDGEIIYHGQDLVKKSEREMRSIRGNDISMISKSQ